MENWLEAEQMKLTTDQIKRMIREELAALASKKKAGKETKKESK